MYNKDSNISESERFKADYNILLRKVKESFRVRDAKWIGISEPKASRVLSGSQFDILTLIEMAVYVGYSVDLFFRQKIEGS